MANNHKTKQKAKRRSPPPNQRRTASAAIIASALAWQNRGDERKAKRMLLNISARGPLNAEASYLLGMAARDQKKYDEAIAHFDKTISLDPTHVNAYFGKGGIFIDQGEYDRAVEQFQRVVSLSPDYANAWYNLGIIAGIQGSNEEALTYYEKAMGIDPGYANAYYNIGCILLNRKQYDEAVAYFEKVLALDPDYADALFNIGAVWQNKREYDKAIAWYEKTLDMKSDYYLAYNNLGVVYQAQFKFEKALEYFQKAIALQPETADAYLNMGNIFREKNDVEKTLECYKKSLALKPSLVGLGNLCGYEKDLCHYEAVYDLTLQMLNYHDLKKHDLATIHDTFIQLCEWEKASSIIDSFRTAALDPEARDVLAGSFMEFCAITDLSPDEIAEQHRIWGEHTEEKVTPFTHEERRNRTCLKKKLRLGYCSPDLREHSVGYLIKDIIASHNREEFEVWCYANFAPKDSDGFTREMEHCSDTFKYIKHLSHEELAEEIYKDEIDILIDLAGHTAGHRLKAMAYKPAPIQITYLGYPNTTGLSRIDCRITDRYAESGPENDYRYSEKLIRLTTCFLAFNGFGNIVPPQEKERRREEILFGCFNNIQKLTPQAVELWSLILREVKHSRIRFKAKQLNTAFVWDNIIREFLKHGIPAERLQRLEYTPTREAHLKCYNDIDVALDTFPYNGTVTTLEALWMNVPIVTLVGETHAQRVGYTILKNLGLDSLIALSGDEYVEKAIDLATRPELIRELRSKMRSNLLASSICNPKILTREMELTFKKIWMDYLRETERQANTQPASGECGAVVQKGATREDDDMRDDIAAASRLRMAMVKLQAGEFHQAIIASSELLDIEGISSLAWYVRGVAQHRLGNDEGAVADLRQSLRLDCRNQGAWKVLGEIHIGRSEVDEANSCLKRVWELEEAAL